MVVVAEGRFSLKRSWTRIDQIECLVGFGSFVERSAVIVEPLTILASYCYVSNCYISNFYVSNCYVSNSGSDN